MPDHPFAYQCGLPDPRWRRGLTKRSFRLIQVARREPSARPARADKNLQPAQNEDAGKRTGWRRRNRGRLERQRLSPAAHC